MPTLFDDALTLLPSDEAWEARLSGEFSNGPVGAPPEAGFPFGGLLAALCARSLRQALALTTPLRTLSVQYLSAAHYDQPLVFRPRLLRGGRSVAYATVEAVQGERITHHATATYGRNADGPDRADLCALPPPLDGLDAAIQMPGPVPRFTQHVDYRFEQAPAIMGGNAGRPAVERVWMRMKGGRPLDEVGLCYLLDAIYPPAWTISPAPSPMTTVDLRYDLLTDATADNAPDGWAFFEFRMLDLGLGWTVDEATAWGADGLPLAVSRQRRKLLPSPRPRG